MLSTVKAFLPTSSFKENSTVYSVEWCMLHKMKIFSRDGIDWLELHVDRKIISDSWEMKNWAALE